METLHAHFERFVRHGLYLRSWSPRTARTYRQGFASLQKCLRDSPDGTDRALGPLTKTHLEDWVVRMKQDELTNGGINMYVRTVNSFLSWLREDGQAAPPPIKLLPNPPKPLRGVSDAEVRLVLGYRPRSRLERRTLALSKLLLDTGLRIDEALGCTVGDADMTAMHLTVTGKGNKRRVVPFSQELRKSLFLLCDGRPPGANVFSTSSGQRLTYRNAYRDIKGLFARAGVEGKHIHPHALRHCFAVTYVRRGGDLYRLSRMLGHSSISTTQLYLRSMGVEHLQEGHSRFSPLSRG